MELRDLPFDDALVVGLQQRYDADIDARYGGHPHLPAPVDFESPHGRFVVAFHGDGDGDEPAACGGMRRYDDTTAELKRLFVVPEARGRGLARAVLADLEGWAAAAGYAQVWLETGTEQPEAMALYEATGYATIDVFGEFADDPRSRCYGKRL